IGIQYVEAWLRGNGCVPIYSLMEDAATAEISRSQLWQWLKHGASITGGPKITPDLLKRYLGDEMDKIRDLVGKDAFTAGKYKEAADLFWDMTVADDFEEFLTLPAYERLSAI
ncbi:MAG: malate synthase A, partial [Pseudomonadota bacterium]